MEYETISKETPEMKQLFSGIRNLTKCVRTTAQTHRPLFEDELYLTGREIDKRLFLSPRTLQDYRDKGIFPYTDCRKDSLSYVRPATNFAKELYKQRPASIMVQVFLWFCF